MAVPDKEYLIGFDPDKCIQGHGCEVACKTWRGLGMGIQYRRILNFWQGRYPQIKSACLSLACLHCVEPACEAACPEEAVYKRLKDGLVVVDDTLCGGCVICAEVCEFGIPQFGDNGTMQKCDMCHDQPLAGALPACVETCPGKALSIIEVSQSEKKVHAETTSRLLRSGWLVSRNYASRRAPCNHTRTINWLLVYLTQIAVKMFGKPYERRCQ